MERGVLVVTGGSRGIGAATARLAAADGWQVVVDYVRDAASAEAVAAAIAASGGTAVTVRADVGTEAGVVTLFEAADALGTVTGLVNNAAMAARGHTRVSDLTEERLRDIFATNVVGAFLCSREAVRRMSTAHGGTGGAIVNVSSAAARLGSPGEYVDYAATKGALETLTIGLAKEVAGEGIRVNAIRPGLIATDFHATAGEAGRVDRLAATVPMGRGGTAEECAEAIVWLLSDRASYTTGSFVDVSGGR